VSAGIPWLRGRTVGASKTRPELYFGIRKGGKRWTRGRGQGCRALMPPAGRAGRAVLQVRQD